MLTTRSWLVLGCVAGILLIAGGLVGGFREAVEPMHEMDRLGSDLTPEHVEEMGEEMETDVAAGLAVSALGGLLLTICVLQLKKRKREAGEPRPRRRARPSGAEPPPPPPPR